MKTTLASFTILCSTSLSLLLAGCSTFERTFGSPQPRFEGGAAIQFIDVPKPDAGECALGELDIRVNSDLIPPEHRAALGKRILDAVGGRFQPWTTKTKTPEYRLVINQINSQQDWDASGVGALLGAGIGAGTGAAIDASNRWRGGGIGAVGGGVLGAVLFGEERNAWAFSVSVTQATSQVERSLESERSDGTSLDTGVQGMSSLTAGNQRQGSVDSSRVMFHSKQYTYPYACVVSVDAGSLHSRSSIEEAARQKLIERLPEAMLGGGEVSWAAAAPTASL